MKYWTLFDLICFVVCAVLGVYYLYEKWIDTKDGKNEHKKKDD